MMVSVSNYGWDTAPIVLVLNNVFISFFDAVEYLMYFATIDYFRLALDGPTPLLKISDGLSHIMNFLTIFYAETRYLTWLKAIDSFELYLLVLELRRTFSAYVILVFELLLQRWEF